MIVQLAPPAVVHAVGLAVRDVDVDAGTAAVLPAVLVAVPLEPSLRIGHEPYAPGRPWFAVTVDACAKAAGATINDATESAATTRQRNAFKVSPTRRA